MTAPTNRQWRLRSRPVGMVAATDFEAVEEPIPDVGPGEVLVRNRYIAFEPAMRGWLEDVKSYVPPVGIGEVMRASGVGEVVESQHPKFVPGQLVQGMLGWQEHALVGGDPTPFGRLQPVAEGVSPELALGALGGTGLTAYFGMVDIGAVKDGDTVLVSGAAGATGSVAGQIARLRGAKKVVGIAGGAEKCAWLTDVAGFDAAIDYKAEDVKARVHEEFPKGVDLFFDNVGGDLLDDVLTTMANFGRVVLCGAISRYNELELPPGPKHYMQIVIRRLTVRGFILIDHYADARRATDELSGWIASGELRHAEDVQEGFENIPATLLRLYAGGNLGKQLLRL